jgi:hypothetical protein
MPITMIDYTRSLSERAESRKVCGPYLWTPSERRRGATRNRSLEGRGFYQGIGLYVDARGSTFDLRLDYANNHHPINWRRSGTFSCEGGATRSRQLLRAYRTAAVSSRGGR